MGPRLLLAALALLGGPVGAKPEPKAHFAGLESRSQVWWPHRELLSPSFVGDTPQNVTVLLGDSAFLPCEVTHLGDRSVTWMRRSDLHILSADVFTYIADSRFKVFHPDNSDEWTLHIKYTTAADAGVYECQVNSDPKISRQVTLTVKDSQLDDPASYGVATTDTRFPDYIFEERPRRRRPKEKGRKNEEKGRRKERGRRGWNKAGPGVAVIEGPGERYIQEGSVLTLVCWVRHAAADAPQRLAWFHGTKRLSYDSPRGGVSIQTEKSPRRTQSSLSLSWVSAADTGQYTCAPGELPPARVTVHVHTADHLHQPVKLGPVQAGSAAPPAAAAAAACCLHALLALLLALAR